MRSGLVLRAARTYVERGWFVFPLAPRSKVPQAGSRGLLDASNRIEDVQTWFASRDDLNIAIATGPSRLVVIDVDGQLGAESLVRWESEHGAFPRTPEQITGSGGRQIFFAAPDGETIQSRAPWRKDYPGIDIRAEGGYVAAPPSIHPNGRTYAFSVSDHPADIPVATLSGSAAEFVASTATESQLQTTPNTGGIAVFPDIIHDGQGRETALVAYAGTMRRFGASEEEIYGALDVFNEARIRPPKSDSDLRRIARSIGRYSPDPDEALRTRHELKHGSLVEGPQDAQDATENDSSIFASLIESFPVWAARADEEVPEIIPGVLHAGSLAMLASPPKTGKTWLAYDLILSVLSGTPFVSRYKVAKTGPVLYVATEGIHADSRDRIRSLAMGKGIDPDLELNDFDIIWRHSVQLDDPEFMEYLNTLADRYVMIAVDVLADAWSGDENHSKEVRSMLAGVRRLTDLGVTVLLLHHTVKPTNDNAGRRSGFNMRGSGSFYGAIDDGIYLTPTGDRCRSLVELETRAGSPAQPEKWEFAWPTETVDGTQSCVLEWAEHSEEVAEVVGVLQVVTEIIARDPGIVRDAVHSRVPNGSPSAVNRALKALVEMGTVREAEATITKDGKSKLTRAYFPMGDGDPADF